MDLTPKEKAQELIAKIQARFDKCNKVDFAETKADVDMALDFCFMILTMNKKNSIDINYWNNVVYELNAL